MEEFTYLIDLINNPTPLIIRLYYIGGGVAAVGLILSFFGMANNDESIDNLGRIIVAVPMAAVLLELAVCMYGTTIQLVIYEPYLVDFKGYIFLSLFWAAPIVIPSICIIRKQRKKHKKSKKIIAESISLLEKHFDETGAELKDNLMRQFWAWQSVYSRKSYDDFMCALLKTELEKYKQRDMK